MGARISAAIVFILTCSMSFGSTNPDPFRIEAASNQLAARELVLWKSAARSAFSEIPQVLGEARCEDTRLPEPLTTPNPLAQWQDSGIKVTVSFIIGADGKVHSPFILEGSGDASDRTVLNAIRAWRYRPATCNGVPTEMEGKTEFSSR
jgi:TonB family protein